MATETEKIPKQVLKKERKSTDLTQKEIAVLRASTKLSDKEIKLWHNEFIQKYPNGKLDKDSFTKIYQDLFPKNDAAISCQALFETIDTNKDNSIDFNEFLFLAAVGNRTANLDERLDLIFDLWDVSNDALIDINELAHLISAMYDRAGVKDRQGDKNPHRRAKEIIKKLDASGDKKLNREEFINGCKNDPVIRQLLVPDS